MITLILPYPISANAYWGTRVVTSKATRKSISMTYVTHEARAYKEDIGWRVKAAGLRRPITGRVSIDILLYPNRPKDWEKRQREHGASWDDTVMCLDLDNANKVLLDALKGIAMDDDKWVRRLTSQRMEPDQHGARVVVTIAPMPAEQPQAGLPGFDEIQPLPAHPKAKAELDTPF